MVRIQAVEVSAPHSEVCQAAPWGVKSRFMGPNMEEWETVVFGHDGSMWKMKKESDADRERKCSKRGRGLNEIKEVKNERGKKKRMER